MTRNYYLVINNVKKLSSKGKLKGTLIEAYYFWNQNYVTNCHPILSKTSGACLFTDIPFVRSLSD